MHTITSVQKANFNESKIVRDNSRHFFVSFSQQNKAYEKFGFHHFSNENRLVTRLTFFLKIKLHYIYL